ncbi:MAG: hypothetical protein N2578_10050, partial [Bdellovibrionaceae bacterium]|nr:hypothetical protein [Pseudobdellovibrionaceae bacterium]
MDQRYFLFFDGYEQCPEVQLILELPHLSVGDRSQGCGLQHFIAMAWDCGPLRGKEALLCSVINSQMGQFKPVS